MTAHHAPRCGDWLTEVAGGQCSLISELRVQRRTLFKYQVDGPLRWPTAHKPDNPSLIPGTFADQQDTSLRHP